MLQRTIAAERQGQVFSLVVVSEGSEVVQVRTILRRPEAAIWSGNIIPHLQATPQRLDMEGEVVVVGDAVHAGDFGIGEPFVALEE